MKKRKFIDLFDMSEQEYLDLFPPLNFQVRNQDDGDTAILDIQGYIGRDIIREWITGEKSPNTVESLKEKLRDITAGKIIVNINSYGGDLNAGIVIKDMMQSKRAEVVTNMQGFSASAATVIAQAGTRRRMPETAFMLPHRAMVGLLGYYNQNTFQALIDDLKVIDDSLISMYEKRAEISAREIADLMDEGEGYGRWIPADEALEMGFIDQVYDPADEEDPDTDHLDSEDEEAENFSNSEGLKKLVALHCGIGIEGLADRFREESEQQETADAEEARSSEQATSNEIFKQMHEV